MEKKIKWIFILCFSYFSNFTNIYIPFKWVYSARISNLSHNILHISNFHYEFHNQIATVPKLSRTHLAHILHLSRTYLVHRLICPKCPKSCTYLAPISYLFFFLICFRQFVQFILKSFLLHLSLTIRCNGATKQTEKSESKRKRSILT